MENKQTVKLRQISIVGIWLAALAVVFVPTATLAQEAGTGASVQGYNSATPLDNGTIVQLVGDESNEVKVATQSELENMFGVTVDRNLLPVTITNDEYENEVFVAVSGTYNVLVSTQAGPIEVGDYITLSSINGIAMNVNGEEKTVFGRALKAFDGTSGSVGSMDIKDTSGNTTQTVKIGSIPVTIGIQRNPDVKSTEANLPDVLKRVGQAIAEKEVSPVRIYLSLGITAISIIAAIVILYSGVRSGVISIGRNPMSKKSIFRSLLEVILTSILILIIGLFAVYLLLKL